MSAISLRRINCCPRRRSGAVVVEASLILMLYLAFVFSIFDFGFVTYSFHTIQERAAEAVRYGVVRPITLTSGCVAGNAATGTEGEMVKILMYGSPDSTSTGMGLLGLTSDKIQICRDYAPFAEERLRLRVAGFRFPMINYFVPGMHTARTFTASMPMEYAPPPSP